MMPPNPVRCITMPFKYLVRTNIQQLCMSFIAYTRIYCSVGHANQCGTTSPFELYSHCTVISTTVFILGWICLLNVCSYQTEGEQPGCFESVGQVDESQSSYCDGGPEYTVQAASGLVTHQQRRGHCVGVDEASVGALQYNTAGGKNRAEVFKSDNVGTPQTKSRPVFLKEKRSVEPWWSATPASRFGKISHFDNE